jgi:hypothetical protein
MVATTNLPENFKQDSATGTKLFFDTYGQEPLEFHANEVDGAIGFFTKRGFDQDTAIVIATVVLKQSKLDGIPVFKFLDSLTKFDVTELSILVGEILNNNRPATSTLGFRTEKVIPNQIRNIAV